MKTTTTLAHATRIDTAHRESSEPSEPPAEAKVAGLAALARARSEEQGPGTIEQRPNGRFRLRFFAGGRLKTADTFDTWEQAEACRVRTIADLARVEAPEALQMLGAFGLTVIEKRELDGVVKDSTNEESRWRNHLRSDAIGQMAVGDVERDDVQTWLERLYRKGLKRQTRLHCLNLLRAVFEVAIDRKPRRHKGPNPCMGIKLKKDRRTHETWTFLEPDQQARLLAAAAELCPAEEPILAFAIGSGLRGGELVSLRLEDLHLKDAEPHVMVRYGDREGDATKSGKPRRLDLLPMAIEALDRWLAALPSYCPDNPRGLVFPRRGGSPRDHDHVLPWHVWKGFAQRGKPGDANYRARIVGLVERAELPDVRWHDLRHTCASSLINGWWGRAWTLAEVQQVLGHSSSKTTERYAHLAESAQRKAARETREASSASSPTFPALSQGPGDSPGTTENPQRSRWSGTPVSNRRPSAWEGLGLPNDPIGLGHLGKSVGKRSAGFELLAAVGRSADYAEVRALSVRLASEVLSSRAVVLAGEILAGGDRAIAAATELAELVAGGAESEVARASGDDR